MPTASLYTLGCRLNQAETAIIANNLKSRGFEIVDFGRPADLTVVNTCTVTEQADAKCRQLIRKSIRSNPQTFVAVVGCYAQMGVDSLRKIDGVDLIVGNEHKMNLAEFVTDMDRMSEPRVIHSPKISRDNFIIESVGLFDNNTRANLKIQDGCNFVCSFCIIAKARGPARSRKFDDILKEARQLVDLGHKEIVLSGVNIGTYKYLDYTFLDILRQLDSIPDLERIRISSIEPTTIDTEIIDFMSDSEKVCHYLHVPIQSGDDAILDSMRRKHKVSDFSRIVDYAVKKMPDIGLGTDVMVGYPGEGEAEFINTKKLLADLPLAYFHVFSYSDRKGTSSYKMSPKVDYHTKKQRSRELIALGKRKQNLFYKQFVNRKVEVLFENKKSNNWQGLTDNYIKVNLESDLNLRNIIREVKLNGFENGNMLGVIV